MTAWILLFVASLAIWISSEYAISAVKQLTKTARISKILFALLISGFIASLPEIGVVFSSLYFHTPQIALGNLIGSQFFLLFIVIPILAILTRGVRLQTPIRTLTLVLALLLALVPLVSLLDQSLDLGELLIVLLLYGVFLLRFHLHPHLSLRIQKKYFDRVNSTSILELLKLIGSLAILLVATNTAVRSIIEISAGLQTSRFLLSMLLLPISTNLSEIRFALATKQGGTHDVEITDFMGSLTFNALLIVLLTLLSGGTIFIATTITAIIVLFIVGVVLFWWFCRSRESLSVREALLLLVFSVGFLACVYAIDWQARIANFF